MKNKKWNIAKILPYPAAMWLVDASREGPTGSIDRIIAINEAIDRCKRFYPEYFNGNRQKI